jgi:hypothetical protein
MNAYTKRIDETRLKRRSGATVVSPYVANKQSKDQTILGALIREHGLGSDEILLYEDDWRYTVEKSQQILRCAQIQVGGTAAFAMAGCRPKESASINPARYTWRGGCVETPKSVQSQVMMDCRKTPVHDVLGSEKLL